jgi:diguanylate cyclase (GGDEF)-like protein
VVKTANSAFFAPTNPVASIKEATVVLGLNLVRSLALSFTLVDLWEDDSSGLDHDEFWRRSIRTAAGTRALAARDVPVWREEAFLAGLLSRLGVLAIGTVVGAPYRELYDDAGGDYSALEALEEARYGFNHRDVGQRLAASWNFPETISASMQHLAAPDNAPPDQRRLARLVAAGDDFAAVFGEAPLPALERYRVRTAEWFGFTETEADEAMTEASLAAASLLEQFTIPAPSSAELAEILARANEVLASIGFEAALTAVQLEHENQAIASDASTDGLTGLANRRHFDAVLAEHVAIAHRYRTPLTVMFIDLDHFKQVNDTHGHQAGDLVLKRIADVIRRTMRDADIAARYGGEEFAVVMPDTGNEDGTAAAERMLTALQCEYVRLESGASLKVTASIGVATLESSLLEPAKSLVARADEAMYSAKANGRNRVVVREPSQAA